MALVKVNFKDEGQDLLYFIVDKEKEVVTEAGPYFNEMYKGSEVIGPFEEGGKIEIFNRFGLSEIKYPIEKIEDHGSN